MSAVRIRSWLVGCAFVLGAAASGAGASSNPEIEYLLAYVADSGCVFHRNGDDHDAADAADHLRLKYSRGRRYADSAEHFIDRLASKSSWSGKAYSVTCGDRTEASGDWLHRALADYRQAQPRLP